MAKNIGDLIDEMASNDKESRKLQAAIKEINKRRAITEGKLMKSLEKQHVTKASGKLAHAMLASRKHPSINNMAKFNKYVKAKEAFDLYQRRINAKAYFDRLANGDTVPGVEIYEHHFVKITPKRG